MLYIATCIFITFFVINVQEVEGTERVSVQYMGAGGRGCIHDEENGTTDEGSSIQVSGNDP